jgi:hypothetical protein
MPEMAPLVTLAFGPRIWCWMAIAHSPALGEAGEIYGAILVNRLLQRRNECLRVNVQTDRAHVKPACREFRGGNTGVVQRAGGRRQRVSGAGRQQLAQHAVRHHLPPVEFMDAGLDQRRKVAIRLVAQGLHRRLACQQAREMFLRFARQGRDQPDSCGDNTRRVHG